MASALSRNGLLARFSVPGAKTLALLSFSLYLSHKGVVHLVNIYAPQLIERPWLAQPVYMSACVAVAAALYACVERPFLTIRDRRGIGTTRQAIELQARADPAL